MPTFGEFLAHVRLWAERLGTVDSGVGYLDTYRDYFIDNGHLRIRTSEEQVGFEAPLVEDSFYAFVEEMARQYNKQVQTLRDKYEKRLADGEEPRVWSFDYAVESRRIFFAGLIQHGVKHSITVEILRIVEMIEPYELSRRPHEMPAGS